MSQGDLEAYAVLVAAKFDDMLLSNFCSVAATTLLFYDYMLTFSRELRCIWGRKFSGATLLFFLNRYLTLIYRVLMVVDMLPWQGLPQQTADNICSGVLHSTQAITLILQLVLAAFTSLRLYAVWSKDRRIFIAVFLLGLVPPGVNVFYYTTITFVSAPPPFVGCGTYVNLSTAASEILAIFNCVFNIASDGIILILTWIKTAEIRRGFTQPKKNGTLTYLIQRDGTIYFVTLLILNVINLVAVKFQAFGSLPAITEVLNSILISRFILNLRGVYLYGTDSKASSNSSLKLSDISTLQFADDMAGNLGAPLDDILTDVDERTERVAGDDEEIAYVSNDPLTVGLPLENGEERLVTHKLKDLHDSEV